MRGNKNEYLTIQSSKEGYTIVESLIFLAITGAIVVSAMFLIGGQQRRSEFNTGIREVQSQISDIINDVSTGFYDSPSRISCTVPPFGGPPTLQTDASAELGGDADCMFVGKVIQFASSDNGEGSAEIYSLVGRRQTPEGTDARRLPDAEPIVFDDTADTALRLPYGIKVGHVRYRDGATNYVAGSVGFVSKLAGSLGAGGITGTQNIDLIAVRGTDKNQSMTDAKLNINGNIDDLTHPGYNPDEGITICFDSGGTNQRALILIGGRGRQTSTTLTISGGKCSDIT